MRKNREMVASDLIDYSDNYSANDFFNASGNWIDKLKNGSTCRCDCTKAIFRRIANIY